MDIKGIGLCVTALVVIASCGGPRPSATLPSSPSPSPVHQPTPSPSIPLVAPTLSLLTPPPPEVTLDSRHMTSPSGEWDAESSFEFLEGGAAFRVKLVVRKEDGSVEWTPVDYTQDGIGYIYPALRWWSPDSQSFYYFNMPTPDGCGDFYPVENEWIALSVEDGSLSTLTLPKGRGHTISPDGRTMIYASTTPPYVLIFLARLDSTEQVLPLPPPTAEVFDVQAGGAVWSPDGSSLALSVAYGDSCRDDPQSFSVLRIDDPSHPTLIPLIQGSPKLIRLLRWDPSGLILVRDWNGYSWWMDSRTGNPTEALLSAGF